MNRHEYNSFIKNATVQTGIGCTSFGSPNPLGLTFVILDTDKWPTAFWKLEETVVLVMDRRKSKKSLCDETVRECAGYKNRWRNVENVEWNRIGIEARRAKKRRRRQVAARLTSGNPTPGYRVSAATRPSRFSGKVVLAAPSWIRFYLAPPSAYLLATPCSIVAMHWDAPLAGFLYIFSKLHIFQLLLSRSSLPTIINSFNSE